eukprot:1150284-Pelagomonas_calceolata.AAC.1
MGRLDVGRNGVWAALKHTVGAGSRQGGLAVQAVGERAALEGGLHPGFRASWETDLEDKRASTKTGSWKECALNRDDEDGWSIEKFNGLAHPVWSVCGLKDKIQHCVAYSRMDTTPYPHPNP